MENVRCQCCHSRAATHCVTLNEVSQTQFHYLCDLCWYWITAWLDPNMTAVDTE